MFDVQKKGTRKETSIKTGNQAQRFKCFMKLASSLW